MSELQGFKKNQQYEIMSEFLEKILPLDIIRYVIFFYINEFNGQRENMAPISLFKHTFNYCVISLNQNEIIHCSNEILTHSIIDKNYTHECKISSKWGLIKCIALTNRRIILAYSDGNICLFDINTYTEYTNIINRCNTISAMIKIPSLLAGFEQLVIATRHFIYRLDIPLDGTLRAQCIRINNVNATIYPTMITSLVGCNDGNVAFAGVYVGSDSRIQLWNPYTLTLISIINGYRIWETPLLKCPDNNLIISIGHENSKLFGFVETVKALDLITGEVVHTIYHNVAFPSSVTMLSDDLIMASSGNCIKIWSLLTGQLVRTIDHGSNIDYLVKTLDNKLIILTRHAIPYVYNIEGQLLMKLGKTSTISIKILTSGKLVTMHKDSKVNNMIYAYIWK